MKEMARGSCKEAGLEGAEGGVAREMKIIMSAVLFGRDVIGEGRRSTEGTPTHATHKKKVR